MQLLSIFRLPGKAEILPAGQTDFFTGFITQSLYHITRKTIFFLHISIQAPGNTTLCILPAPIRMGHKIIGNKQPEI